VMGRAADTAGLKDFEIQLAQHLEWTASELIGR
jgi:hypothetical protein